MTLPCRAGAAAEVSTAVAGAVNAKADIAKAKPKNADLLILMRILLFLTELLLCGKILI